MHHHLKSSNLQILQTKQPSSVTGGLCTSSMQCKCFFVESRNLFYNILHLALVSVIVTLLNTRNIRSVFVAESCLTLQSMFCSARSNLLVVLMEITLNEKEYITQKYHLKTSFWSAMYLNVLCFHERMKHQIYHIYRQQELIPDVSIIVWIHSQMP